MLATAFTLSAAPDLVAFVGGGGKTSLLFALAQSLGQGVVVTTTTRIFAAQIKRAPAVCFTASAGEVRAWQQRLQQQGVDMAIGGMRRLPEFLTKYGYCLVVGEVRGDKALGVAADLPGELLRRADVRIVLVEADGSRMRPIKAPAVHEPVIPPTTTVVVPVVGIDALHGSIADVAHRPELVVQLLGERWSVTPADSFTPEMVAALLTHPQGGRKAVPAAARIIPVINKVESTPDLEAARQIARHVLADKASAKQVAQVVIAAARAPQPIREVQRRVTAVVLAAGASRRMGKSKQLLPWGERTVLGQVLHHLQDTAVADIVVVTGHEGGQVTAVADRHEVRTLHNAAAAAGGEMITSLQTAVRHLPDSVAAVLVVLGDQPMVKPATMSTLLAAFGEGVSELLAPVFQGRRGNPVLIGRRFFGELLALPADAAPRHLLQRHADALRLVPVTDDSILNDLDRPEDYERFRPQ